MKIPSGSTDRKIYFVAVDSTDLKTRETGLTTFTVYRSRNGGTATVMTTPTISELDATNMPGVYDLLLDEDTTIAAGSDTEELAVHITQASMAPVTRTIELYRPDTTLGNTIGVNASGHLSRLVLCDTTTTNTDQRGTDSAFLAASAPTNFGDLAITASAGYVTSHANSLSTAARDNIADDVWNFGISGITTANRAGQVLGAITNAAATINTDSAFGQIMWNGIGGSEFDRSYDSLGAIRDRGDSAWITATGFPTAAAITDAVWDEATSGHTGAGSYGKAVGDGVTTWVTASGFSTHSASDVWGVTTRVLTANTNLNDPTAAAITDAVWDEATSGHTSAGTYGKAVGDGITTWVTATGFSTHSAADVWGVTTRVLTANTNLNDPTVAAIVDAVWDEATSGHTSAGTYGKAVGDGVTTWVTATGFSTHSAADVWTSGTRTLSAATTIDTEIADAVLLRNVSNTEGTAGEHTLTTIVLAMLESSVSGTTWTIKETDGSTTHATKTVTTDSGADPITGVS